MRREVDKGADILGSVSRETLERLDQFAENLGRWTGAINLVASGDRGSLWDRHVVDSAQLAAWLSQKGLCSWCDLGSGGGLPAIVLAIIAQEVRPELVMTMIESDARKAAFLRMQVNELGLAGRVISRRIEVAQPQEADVVSARALAPLPALLRLAHRHARSGATLLFPKGRKFQEEVVASRKEFDFSLTTHPSRSDPDGAILEIRSLVVLGSDK